MIPRIVAPSIAAIIIPVLAPGLSSLISGTEAVSSLVVIDVATWDKLAPGYVGVALAGMRRGDMLKQTPTGGVWQAFRCELGHCRIYTHVRRRT